MKLFCKYLKYKLKPIIIFITFSLLFLISFYLYHLPLKAVIYPTLLCLLFGIILLLYDFFVVKKRHNEFICLQNLTAELLDDIPQADSISDEDYRKIINMLCEQQKIFSENALIKYNNMVNYYTVWAHQIKTPIASMHLHLQNSDSELSRQLQIDLYRIEQYVDMVLTYLRLDSDSTDYVIQKYDLDSIVRPIIKKQAGEFIARHLKLDYADLHITVLTDEKWLSFVVEQVLSNALKYTPSGVISVYSEQPNILCIKDTGIGIASEDLPRIFEKGYTGFNGRTDNKASGIGLYLCKRICDNLGHNISAFSDVGSGTTIKICLDTKEIGIE